MASHSFKSVGESSNPRSVQEVQPIPVGILTPMRASRKTGGPFEMSLSVLDQQIDNFRNMLLTNHGERLPTYDFGANLRSLVSERLALADYDEQAMNLIKATTEKYMPFISLDMFETEVLQTDEQGISKIRMRVDFSIPRLSTQKKRVEVTISNYG